MYESNADFERNFKIKFCSSITETLNARNILDFHLFLNTKVLRVIKYFDNEAEGLEALAKNDKDSMIIPSIRFNRYTYDTTEYFLEKHTARNKEEYLSDIYEVINRTYGNGLDNFIKVAILKEIKKMFLAKGQPNFYNETVQMIYGLLELIVNEKDMLAKDRIKQCFDDIVFCFINGRILKYSLDLKFQPFIEKELKSHFCNILKQLLNNKDFNINSNYIDFLKNTIKNI